MNLRLNSEPRTRVAQGTPSRRRRTDARTAPAVEVPLFDLARGLAPVHADAVAAFERLWAAGQFTLGPDLEDFERRFAEFCGADHCVGVSNGTVAVQLGLLALGVVPGAEVITVPNTFVATVEAIDAAGAKPALVDVDPVYRCMDAGRLSAAVGPETGAVVPVHLFGRLAPVAELQAVIEPVQPAGPARTVPIAPSAPGRSQGMAMQPEDADFAQAAIWRVKLPASVDASRDLRLRVRYTGDVLRAYHADTLLDDDFYHARPFEIGLRRYGSAVYQDGLTLKILPLREDAPIYITDRSQLKFDDNHTALTLDGVDVIETCEVQLEART